ncbi:ParA family protein [candidate division TA06 bacterium]|uniref:ParA family protein n=1 Tax=candidate division TA06 bacterium TaxID=2250710 RepID=A0A523UQL8_UNCT6|nr:MAG: ParA family protein [candidate division TA06 bacterium]
MRTIALLNQKGGTGKTTSTVNVGAGLTELGRKVLLIDLDPQSALTYAREVFIPLQTEYLALQGLARLTETIETVRKRLNPDLVISGIIATRFDGRKVLNREVLAKIQEHFGAKVFKTAIRENISLAEAPSFGKTIFEYRPGSHGAEDYESLCREILRRG